METERKSTGTCAKCGGRCTYQSGRTYGFWVHADTGTFSRSDPVPHDCNTHILRDRDS
jgi:hypothetical protein